MKISKFKNNVLILTTQDLKVRTVYIVSKETLIIDETLVKITIPIAAVNEL